MWEKIHDERFQAADHIFFVVAVQYDGTWYLEYQVKDRHNDSNASVVVVKTKSLPESWEELLELFIAELRKEMA
jgi:hypothetical protein